MSINKEKIVSELKKDFDVFLTEADINLNEQRDKRALLNRCISEIRGIDESPTDTCMTLMLFLPCCIPCCCSYNAPEKNFTIAIIKNNNFCNQTPDPIALQEITDVQLKNLTSSIRHLIKINNDKNKTRKAPKHPRSQVQNVFTPGYAYHQVGAGIASHVASPEDEKIDEELIELKAIGVDSIPAASAAL